MKIERIELFHVAMPLVYPFRTAFGDTAVIESVLLKMSSGGVEGWGESAPWALPAFSSEYAAGVFALGRDLIGPQLIGKEIATGNELQELLKPIRGNRFAKALFDLAWWDLHARSLNQPLWKTIGGAGPTVTVGADIGVMETIPQLLAEVNRAVDQRFKRIKLKYRPGWGVDMVAAVRKEYPEVVIHVDCNSGYQLRDLAEFRSLEQFNLAMIEQPLANDDLVDHVEFRKQVRIPLCLDESISSPAIADQALRIGACDWINLKHGRIGGLTPAIAIHDSCRRAGVGNWVGGMLESAVGQAFAIALATLDNIKYPADIFPTDRFYKTDLAAPPIVLSGPSQVTALDAPGIGFRPAPRQLAAAKRQTAVIGHRGGG